MLASRCAIDIPSPPRPLHMISHIAKLIAIRRSFLMGAVCLLSFAHACAAQESSRSDASIFDDLVTKEFIASGCQSSLPSRFATTKAGGEKIYSILFRRPNTDNEVNFSCSVKVARAGTLLQSQRYEETYQAAREDALKRGKKYDEFYFPTIGKRAHLDNSGFGPGGGGFSLTYTTTDGCYDIKVEQAGLSAEGVKEPKTDIHRLAKDLSDLYDKRAKIGQADCAAGNK